MNRKLNGLSVFYPKEYAKYRSILQRTNKEVRNKKAIDNYKNKGITCSEEWQKSFKTFLEDMGECPEGFEIDRIDNSKGYSKDNCRWSSRATNQYNRGKSITNKSTLPKGVRYNKKIRKFTAQICIAYHSYHLGCFDSCEEASNAYNAIATEWYGFIPTTAWSK